jgi:hypothetical protein
MKQPATTSDICFIAAVTMFATGHTLAGVLLCIAGLISHDHAEEK